MKKILLTTVEQIAKAKYDIELWLLEDREFNFYKEKKFFVLSRNHLSFTVEFNKLIFAYWTLETSESWKVISYQTKQNQLFVEILVPFQKKTITYLLEKKVPKTQITNLDKKAIRANYLMLLEKLIKQHFYGYIIEKSSLSQSIEYGYKIAIARLLIKYENSIIAAVGISQNEDPQFLASLLGQGLKWLNTLETRFTPLPIKKLMFFAPPKATKLLAERLTLIKLLETEIELFEVDELKISSVQPFDQGDLGLLVNKLKLNYCKIINDKNTSQQIQWIKSLAPSLIELKPNLQNTKINFSINGLDFATIRLRKNANIKFGVSTEKKILNSANQEELITLVKEITYYRQAASPNQQHKYYQTRSEAWLESIICRNLNYLDVNLDINCFYRQVPVIKDSSRFIDILAVTKYGQLVIIELKASEDKESLFQCLDYWLRIEWYRLRKDLNNYFPTIKLKDRAALIYLVTPKLRSHPDLSLLGNFIDKKVPLYRIEINDNWRQELKVESHIKLT
ncbi:MAG: hypothetical protein J0M03_14240 [Acidobacteria bacterium]|nr:hypothetical protein [Acidobacteriota bacterium]